MFKPFNKFIIIPMNSTEKTSQGFPLLFELGYFVKININGELTTQLYKKREL